MNETTVEKGTRFEDEVAEIYRSLDGVTNVIQNHLLSGIQIDIYVEMQVQGGITIRLAIDAKNYETNLPADEARKCVNDFNILKSNNLIDKGVVVTSKGFSSSANSAIIDSGYEAKQIKDLMKNSLDFTKYLKQWIKDYETERSKIIKYISLSATKNGNEKIRKLDDYLLNWIKNDTPHITILGNYGAGKSTTLKYIMATQAKKYINNPEQERIPIFIELKGYRQAPKSQSLITDLLVNEFGLNINYHKFKDMNEKGQFLIILDGFDEMADKVIDGLPQQHFDELSKLAAKNSKVILTSRTHYFRDPAHVEEVHGRTDLMAHVEEKKGYEIIHINNFTENNINIYLRAALGDKWNEYKETIKKTYDLSSLSEVPILLNMIVQVLPNMINENISLNRSRIYKIFTDQWLRRDSWRASSNKADRVKFSKTLAVHFYRHKLNSVHWNDLPQFIRESFSSITTQNDLDVFEFDVRTSNFLKREDNSGQYSFLHKSFMEFFVAEYLHDNILQEKSNGLDYLKDFMGSKVIYEFLLEMLTEDDIKLLKEDITPKKIREEDINYGRLMSNNTYTGKQNLYDSPESLGNCVYLLIKSGITNMKNIQVDRAILKGAEFNNVSFEAANLSGANFENCVLNNVKFNNASLDRASFHGAKLKDVDFTKANLDKVDFRDITSIGTTLQKICAGKFWGTAKYDISTKKRLETLYRK